MEPQPSDAELEKIYDSTYFDSWGESDEQAPATKLKVATFQRYVLPAARLEAGARILDCGAAYGALMGAASDAGLEPYGVELVPNAASQIEWRFGADRVFCGMFESANFKNLPDRAAFHAIFMCDFIEHVRDPLAVLKKAADWLVNDGKLVLTTPNTNSISSRLLQSNWPHYHPEHLLCFNPNNIKKILERAGFHTLSSGPAQKVITLEYLRSQTQGRQQTLARRFIQMLTRFQPIERFEFPLSLGQMMLVAAKA